VSAENSVSGAPLGAPAAVKVLRAHSCHTHHHRHRPPVNCHACQGVPRPLLPKTPPNRQLLWMSRCCAPTPATHTIAHPSTAMLVKVLRANSCHPHHRPPVNCHACQGVPRPLLPKTPPPNRQLLWMSRCCAPTPVTNTIAQPSTFLPWLSRCSAPNPGINPPKSTCLL
jgi:hypothetical protein